MPTEIIEKHPDAEVMFKDFDFTDDLPDDENLADISEVTAVDADGNPSKKVVGVVGREGMILTAILKRGLNGQDYIVTFNAVGLTTARTATKQLEMRVREHLMGSL